MDRIFLSLGALSACIGVAAGAYGAHGLQAVLSERLLAPFETAVRYQLYHAFGLLGAAWAYTRWPGTLVKLAGCSFVFGTLLFSGSLYVLCLTGIPRLGAITPLGGLAFLAGWLCLAWAPWRSG